MWILALAGTLAFVVVGAVVGVRLLLLARRTRQLPELLAGGGLFAYSLLAQPLFVASRPIGAELGQGAALTSLAFGMVAQVATFAGLYLFNWFVFHRSSRGVLALAVSGVALAAVVAVGLLWSLAQVPHGAPYTLSTRFFLSALILCMTVSMGWTSGESLRYYGLMRRRLALGLADPVVTNRFGVWGAGCAANTLITLPLLAFVAAGVPIVAHPAPLLVMAGGGMIAATCWYLSFLPPARYQSWVRGRTVSQET